MKDTKRRLAVDIPVNLMERLDKQIEISGLNKASIVILAIMEYLDKLEEKQQ